MSARPVIITGARGRIAVELAAAFRASGVEPLRFSRSAGEGCRLLDDLFRCGVLDGPHEIYHCAWSSVPATSESLRGIEWREDLPLLWRLLSAIAAGGSAAHSRFVFLSSGGTVYGNANHRPNRETDLLAPIGWHGLAKSEAERIIARFAADTGLCESRVRLSNPYGFSVPASKPQGVIPLMIAAASKSEPFKLWGDGTARKDFLHVSDFASAIRAIRDGNLTGPINVASGQSVDLRTLADLVSDAVGKRLRLEFGHAPRWDVTDSRIDPTYLQKITGWSPRVPLADGIRLATDHLLKKR